ncbi:MAG: sulfatase-like hydrolase/transferase, partial [Chloroflexi bacterium]|nr:sulfatase-like hydrolase/transferase [Chloroflexota bacterium]
VLTRMNNDVIPATEADVRRFETLYDAEVMRTDAALGRLFAELESRGLWDGVVVAVTSDHGEEFDEHGLIGWHSLTCYEEVQRVPLVVKAARGRQARRDGGGRRIDAPIATLDIAATILDLAGLAVPESMWGRSAAPLMAGRSRTPHETLCEIEDGRGAAIVLDGWKYHRRTEASAGDRRTFKRRLRTFGRYATEELYRLESDPREQVNLVEAEPQRARALRRLLDARLDAARAQLAVLTRATPAAPPPMDEEHVRRLRALGYVQ